jgi:hypothetical protein
MCECNKNNLKKTYIQKTASADDDSSHEVAKKYGSKSFVARVYGSRYRRRETGDSRPVVAVVRVVDNHGNQLPNNNVTTSERELYGDGSTQY